MSTPPSDRRYLVTGASGFVGANLVHRLVREGARVHVLARATSDLWRLEGVQDRVQVHRVDMRDLERLQDAIAQVKPHVIYHCAAFGGYPGEDDPETIVTTNLQGVINLLQAASAYRYERLVNVGSLSEYGLKATPMREEDALEPVNLYGVTKAAATLHCRAVAQASRQPIVTLRLFSPYGPYEESTRLIPSVISACLAGQAPGVTLGEQVRDFVYIDDAIDCCLRAASASVPPGEVINVGSGRQHRVRDVVEQIVALINPALTPRWGAVPSRAQETSTWVADISKAAALLGWRPSTSLTDGLRHTIHWFQEHLSFYAAAEH